MSKETTNYQDFRIKWDLTDIEFNFENPQGEKIIYANKLVLSLWSPVFRVMFGENFKEKNAKEIKLPDKNIEDFNELMKVLHPPNKPLDESNIPQLLPLLQEYQIDILTERSEEILCNSPASVENFLLSQKFCLKKLNDYCCQYLKRIPVSRLKNQNQYDQLDSQFLINLLTEKLEKMESNIDNLREVRMVLERKKPTTFPGMNLLCSPCTGARDQQVDCEECLKNCCHKLTNILRNMDA